MKKEKNILSQEIKFLCNPGVFSDPVYHNTQLLIESESIQAIINGPDQGSIKTIKIALLKSNGAIHWMVNNCGYEFNIFHYHIFDLALVDNIDYVQSRFKVEYVIEGIWHFNQIVNETIGDYIYGKL